MILVLNKPILGSNGAYIKKMEYDLYGLTIKDFNDVEKLYFNLTQNNAENLIQESHIIYKLCAFFISCCKVDKNLSFVEFLRIKGKDKRRVENIVDEFFVPKDIINKKKD